MEDKINPKVKILAQLEKDGSVQIKSLIDTLEISKQTVIKHLNDLITSEKIVKIGSAPNTAYIINNKKSLVSVELAENIQKVLDENFVYINNIGIREDGSAGFASFCRDRKMDIKSNAKEYFDTYKQNLKQKNKPGLIDASFKIKESLKDINLDALLYTDFYALPKYGKTKLGQMVFLAKQSQDKKMMREIVNETKSKIEKLIETKNIDCIAYVPPTVRRQVQIMTEIKKGLKISLPEIKIYKILNEVAIPQKTLSKIEDRVTNAEKTMYVENSSRNYKNILLIDDAVGSGATLNEIAKKIKRQKIATKVFGLSIVGSLKGFDVISEV